MFNSLPRILRKIIGMKLKHLRQICFFAATYLAYFPYFHKSSAPPRHVSRCVLNVSVDKHIMPQWVQCGLLNTRSIILDGRFYMLHLSALLCHRLPILFSNFSIFTLYSQIIVSPRLLGSFHFFFLNYTYYASSIF